MLQKPISKIEYDDKGKFVGVTSEGETVKAKNLIGDPSYFVGSDKRGEGEEKVFLEGRVVRAICILRHPIPNTDDSDSVQLIIPQKQVGRKHGACLFSLIRMLFSLLINDSNKLRHLHRRGFVDSQRLRQGCLHRNGFHRRRDQQPRS